MTIPRRLFVSLWPLVLPVAALAAQTPTLTVHDIFGTRRYSPDLQTVEWDARMPFFTTIVSDDSGHTDLVRVDANTGARAVLIPGSSLVPPGAAKPVAI